MSQDSSSRYHCSATGEHIKVSTRARGLMQALRDVTVRLVHNPHVCKDWNPISLARRDIVAYIAHLETQLQEARDKFISLSRRGVPPIPDFSRLSQIDWSKLRFMTVDELLAAGRGVMAKSATRS